YVLNPEYLRITELAPPLPELLEVEIISAQQLPKPKLASKGEIVDPFCELEVITSTVVRRRTRTIANNGFNPIWKEKFIFEIHRPEITFLRFAIYDQGIGSDEILASYCIMLDNLQQGYRHLPLKDYKGERIHFSHVFIRSNRRPLSKRTRSSSTIEDIKLPPSIQSV
ncbi:hypothetical protein K7432_012335, partial [Basidiobolus ranarum]